MHGARRVLPLDVCIRRERDEILRIADRHGAFNVRVFGSAARGQTRPDSDVDFLVDVGERRSFFFPGGLIADLADLLGCRVDVVTSDALPASIRERIYEEAVLL